MAAKQRTDLNEVVTSDEVIDDLAGVVQLAEMLGVVSLSPIRSQRKMGLSPRIGCEPSRTFSET